MSETENKIFSKPKYPFYENILNHCGYVFVKHKAPYDIWKKGNSEIGICVPCNILALNLKRIPCGSIERGLITILFNK